MKCLLVEDDLETSRYICGGLASAGHSVVGVGTGAEGLRLACAERWDAIIMDRMLPGSVDGLSVVAELRQRAVVTPILILSALSALDERVRGLREGGDDYLTKPFALPELQARIEALARRSGLHQRQTSLTIGDLTLDLETRVVERAGRPIALQPREFHLLEYLIRHRDQIVTRQMLIESVWNYRFDPQTGVIDVMVSRLRQKVDRGFERSLIHTVRGVGYTIRE